MQAEDKKLRIWRFQRIILKKAVEESNYQTMLNLEENKTLIISTLCLIITCCICIAIACSICSCGYNSIQPERGHHDRVIIPDPEFGTTLYNLSEKGHRNTPKQQRTRKSKRYSIPKWHRTPSFSDDNYL